MIFYFLYINYFLKKLKLKQQPTIIFILLIHVNEQKKKKLIQISLHSKIF